MHRRSRIRLNNPLNINPQEGNTHRRIPCPKIIKRPNTLNLKDIGASILGHHTTDPDDDARINLLRVNHNAVLITDGDRTAKTGKGSRLKASVSRISKEIEALEKSHVWVIKAKEIESYVPTSTLATIFEKEQVSAIGQYDSFATSKGEGYYHKHTKRKSFNKVEFAQQVVPLLTLDGLKKTFEWEEQMKRIVETIQSWNER